MAEQRLFSREQRTTTHPSSIKDNRAYGRVGEFLKEKLEAGSAVSIVSAYFTVNAFQHLRTELEGIDKLRFLFGDPAFIKVKDEDKPRRNFRMTDEGLKMAAQVQQRAVAKACADWLERKAEIRSLVRPNFLHGKLYHITAPNGTEEAITGSSNFTAQGLGFGNTPNMELNMVINDRRDRTELKQWFEELWNDDTGLVEDVKRQVLDDMKLLFAETPPEFVYFKTLYHVFEKFLKDEAAGGLLDDRTGFLESEIWNMLFAFQKDGVKGAINKIKTHGGCIIADSVGLGKTFEALAVIKYFEGLGQNVLVLCPKKLAHNWTIYQSRRLSPLSPFKKDKFNYRLLYHTDMGRTRGTSEVDGFDMANFPWGAWDLIVIDESHNFRGNPEVRLDDDGNHRYNRTAWLLKKLISEGVKSKVLLLTATPVNTNLRDLRNQIQLIQGVDEDTAQLLKRAQAQFTNWADPKKNPDRNVKQLMEQLDSAFFKLLDELTIARSRNHIKSFYAEEVIGHFPERAKPVSIYPALDLENRIEGYDAINEEILKYELAVYNPSRFIDEKWVAHYEAQAALEGLPFSQGKRERLLIHMMKKGFLKRLESSIHSFAVSMDRTIQRIEALEKRIKEYQKKKSEAEEVEATEPDGQEKADFDEDDVQWEVGKRMKFKLAHMEGKLGEWLEVLASDKRTMVRLYNTAKAIDAKRDAKLEELKALIARKTYNPPNPGNKKVIVFTAFADTAEYLYDNLKNFAEPEFRSHIALVTGTTNKTTFGRNEFNHILTNFSPISKQRALKKDMPQDGCIDVLIASDCISEGQNLQDCDYLINYDIHWNPVRVIQRFGRIDRLGSTNATVHLVNFWPTEDLDKYIDLKIRVETRMALVDLAATADDNLLTNEQVEELISEDLKYRNRQLKKLKEEVLDIEDSGDTLSLTDLTLDDFRTELLNFLKGNEDRLREAPEGLYAVVPSPGHAMGARQYDLLSPGVKEVIKPGVLLCLRERKRGDDEQQKAKEAINVTAPYFLVYVREDGTVRFSFTQPKQTLEVFRSLCQGKQEAYMELCELFNRETEKGMGKYDALIERATADIASLFRKRSGAKLGNDRQALLIPDTQQASTPDDFDLVTWLVIK
ncbi:MAG: RNA polymerase-associated protein RapA [Fimbriimonadaceae bacterium]|nr:RNA polymerase-associated protein RapA [Fimbriimonadaceae bacterium]